MDVKCVKRPLLMHLLQLFDRHSRHYMCGAALVNHVLTKPVNHAAAVPQVMIGAQTASSGVRMFTFPRYMYSSLTPSIAPSTPQQIAMFVRSEVLSRRTTNGTPTATTTRLSSGFSRRA